MGLATPWDARCLNYKGGKDVQKVNLSDQESRLDMEGVGGTVVPPMRKVRVPEIGADGKKQRWGREAYNAYMKAYMARRRSQ